jgi:hypothetical protein
MPTFAELAASRGVKLRPYVEPESEPEPPERGTIMQPPPPGPCPVCGDAMARVPGRPDYCAKTVCATPPAARAL